MVGGLDNPTDGEVYVDGRKLSKMNKEQLAVFRRRKVGFVFQSYNLVQDLNVYENIVLPIELDGGHINEEFINNILNLLKLTRKERHFLAPSLEGSSREFAIARAFGQQASDRSGG